MKKMFIMLFIAASTMFVACGGGGDASLEGSWKLDSVEGEELTEAEKSTVMTFNGDGTMTQQRGERKRDGKWEWLEEGKKFKMGEGNNTETIIVYELTSDKLVIAEEGDEEKATLVRQ